MSTPSRGLGIHLVTSMADRVEGRRLAHGNRLVISRAIRWGARS
ncbi:MAG: hypothetical protein V3V17_04565 [Alphaproteobacteria bacterium]